MRVNFSGQVPLLELQAKHIEALASAPCSDVYTTLNREQPMSIREVAQELGKSPAAVGEHIRTLVKVGLVISTGTRKRRSRTETLYVHKGQVIRLNVETLSPKAISAYVKRFKAQMRRAERQLELAYRVMKADRSYVAFYHYRWTNAYLSPEDTRLVKQKAGELNQLVEDLNQPDPDVRAAGDFVRVTVTGMMLPTEAESRAQLKRR